MLAVGGGWRTHTALTGRGLSHGVAHHAGSPQQLSKLAQSTCLAFQLPKAPHTRPARAPAYRQRTATIFVQGGYWR